MTKTIDILKEYTVQQPESVKRGNRCPHCDSSNVAAHSHQYTLVGGDPDPNHHWVQSSCNACNMSYTYEYKLSEGKQWFTDQITKPPKCIRGMIFCFEAVTYTHKDCGGDFKRTYYKLDGVTEVSGLHWNKEGAQFREFWICMECNTQVEIPQ